MLFIARITHTPPCPIAAFPIINGFPCSSLRIWSVESFIDQLCSGVFLPESKTEQTKLIRLVLQVPVTMLKAQACWHTSVMCPCTQSCDWYVFVCDCTSLLHYTILCACITVVNRMGYRPAHTCIAWMNWLNWCIGMQCRRIHLIHQSVCKPFMHLFCC